MAEAKEGSTDLFMGYGTLVYILVGAHVAALLFWITMLFRSTPKKAPEHKE